MSMPFVLRGLGHELHISEKANLGRDFLENLAMLYLSWRWLLGYNYHNSSSLQILSVTGDNLQVQLEKQKRTTKGDDNFVIVDWPKYHYIIY